MIKRKIPKYHIGDVVNTDSGTPFVIHEMMGSYSGNFMYRDNSLMPYISEQRLHLVKAFVEDEREVIEEEISNEAEFEPQKYLSRLDKELHIDEAVKYFGQAELLNEIGVDDCIDHFGEDTILEEIGKASAERYFSSNKRL